MDWLTHYMIAYLIGKKLKLDDSKIQELTLGALILDIDVVYYLFPNWIIPVHGTLSHTLIGALVFGAIATAIMWYWKRNNLMGWIAFGITTHLALDLLNTMSVFDGGKRLLYPITDTVFTIQPYVPTPSLTWAIVSAAVFSFSLVMASKLTLEGEPPWRVWFDERPVIEYWKNRRAGN